MDLVFRNLRVRKMFWHEVIFLVVRAILNNVNIELSVAQKSHLELNTNEVSYR